MSMNCEMYPPLLLPRPAQISLSQGSAFSVALLLSPSRLENRCECSGWVRCRGFAVFVYGPYGPLYGPVLFVYGP